MFKKSNKTEENCHFILWQPPIKSSITQRDNCKLVQCVSVIGCQSPQLLKCVLLYAVYTELMQPFCPLSSLCQSGFGRETRFPSSAPAVLVNQWRLVDFVWWPSNVVSPFLLLTFCMYYFFLFLLLLCCCVVYGPLSLLLRDKRL